MTGKTRFTVDFFVVNFTCSKHFILNLTLSAIAQQQRIERNATRSVIGQILFIHVSVSLKIKVQYFIYSEFKIQQMKNLLANKISQNMGSLTLVHFTDYRLYINYNQPLMNINNVRYATILCY